LPIVGDGTYGGAPAARMMLHCASLGFRNEKGVEICLNAPLDESFEAFMVKEGVAIPSSHDTAGTRSP
jgi:hypothetical protein